jgi:hypothetical protein
MYDGAAPTTVIRMQPPHGDRRISKGRLMAKRRSAPANGGTSPSAVPRPARSLQRPAIPAPRAAEAGFGVAMSMAWREADARREQERRKA